MLELRRDLACEAMCESLVLLLRENDIFNQAKLVQGNFCAAWQKASTIHEKPVFRPSILSWSNQIEQRLMLHGFLQLGSYF